MSRSRKDGLDIDHIPAQKALELALRHRMADLTDEEVQSFLRRGASIAIPVRVHQNHSETYGGRNTKYRQSKDAEDLRAAVNSNVDAIKRGLLEEGFAEFDIEVARQQLHDINQAQGWY
ncbi:hypothetical protein [Pseudomonas sp. CFBP13528]|nr:hypothetical protein [Pseudomonas sp. CFBP13528]